MAEHFHALRVAEIVPETSEANSIRFEIPPELRDRFAFKAGQHLTLRATLNGEEVRRNYSLCTAPDENDWMVTVKRIGGGLFSNWVGDELKAGDTVEVMPPHGSFTTEFDAAKSRHLVGIAGGSGITPVMSLIKTTLRSEPNSRVTLL
jgi:ring-1,2-phenylacetyl-CoA epoxidase subunit PaaE